MGAAELFVEKGSKEARAAAKPPIFPLGILLLVEGLRFGVLGLAFWLTRADHDFGGGRGAGGGGGGEGCC